MEHAWVRAVTLSCAAGVGLAEVRQAIAERRTGLAPRAWPEVGDAWLGRVSKIDGMVWPEPLSAWDSRNDRLAWLGVHQDGMSAHVEAALADFGAARVGLILGTSTSCIGRTEEAYRSLEPDGAFAPQFVQPVHHPHATAAFLAHALGIGGPVLTVSTACSSSAKGFASARRWLECGVVDAVLVGGVDSLCRSTVYGFESLQLVSRGICRPFDHHRDGLNIGEAAAFALLTRARPSVAAARLLGCGESCDAHHMSSPHPEGLGARVAMEQALAEARISAADLDYVNLHGTGTRANDAVESLAIAEILPPEVAASSTKGWTGHTLGAAGLVEAVLAIDVLHTGLMPGNLNLEELGGDIAFDVLRENRSADARHVLTNSFGFGGNNCSLLFGRAE